MNKAEREALIVILQNQIILSDMIANALGKTPAELQGDANRLAVAANEAVNALEKRT